VALGQYPGAFGGVDGWVYSMSREVVLNNGMVTLVDDDDYEWVSKHPWGYQKMGGYVKRSHRPNGKVVTLMLHREILKAPSNLYVDHINRNPLDNRKCNLRLVNDLQNSRNRSRRKDNKTGYKGVQKDKRTGRWIANVACKNIGYFATAEEAARAYDRRALELYGAEYAVLNFPVEAM
jgi:hypothetical protein